MIKKLGDIAEIQFGPYEKGLAKGSIKYLLASHFDEVYQLSKFESSFISGEVDSEKKLLQKNDVILAGKGQRTFAWAYEDSYGPCVPSSLFFILKTDEEVVLGKYLTYFLNSERVQNTLKLIGAGGTIPSIPKKELKQIKVSIPSIARQRKIIEMAKLVEEDVMLTQELLNKKKAVQRTVINKLITNQIEK